MNYKFSAIIFFALLISGICSAQTKVVEDFKVSATTQEGKQYPQVNSEGRVRVQIYAPEAHKVQLDIGGVKYDLNKDEKGIWIGESAPQDEGFHYYQLNIDGASVPDPGTLYFYGAGRWGSGIEIPASDKDFYAVKKCSSWDLSVKIFTSLELTIRFYEDVLFIHQRVTIQIHKPLPCIYIYSMEV